MFHADPPDDMNLRRLQEAFTFNLLPENTVLKRTKVGEKPMQVSDVVACNVTGDSSADSMELHQAASMLVTEVPDQSQGTEVLMVGEEFFLRCFFP